MDDRVMYGKDGGGWGLRLDDRVMYAYMGRVGVKIG